jgi:hypothetical protein
VYTIIAIAITIVVVVVRVAPFAAVHGIIQLPRDVRGRQSTRDPNQQACVVGLDQFL